MEKQKEENQVGDTLSQNQAINVLIQGARIAQGKGAFTLEDASIITKAIHVFVPPKETQQEEAEGLNKKQNHSDAVENKGPEGPLTKA